MCGVARQRGVVVVAWVCSAVERRFALRGADARVVEPRVRLRGVVARVVGPCRWPRDANACVVEQCILLRGVGVRVVEQWGLLRGATVRAVEQHGLLRGAAKARGAGVQRVVVGPVAVCVVPVSVGPVVVVSSRELWGDPCPACGVPLWGR